MGRDPGRGEIIAADWTAPGPGTWELDTTHFGPTVSRPARDMVEHSCPKGLGEGFDLLGAPLATMDARFVHGRFYRRLVPLIGGDRDLPPPPAWALRFAFRVVPKLRRRAAVADRAFADGSWHSEYERWEAEWKPALVAANRRFGAVDDASLTDGQLADHLDALWAHVLESTTLHFRLHTSDMGPIGRMLVAARDWGIDGPDLMGALAGASPSTSAPRTAVNELRAELRAADVEPATLDEVRAVSSRAAELLDGYLAEYGDRLTTGYDFTHATLRELPAVVLASITDARPTGVDDARARGDAALTALRDRVPAADRDHFDQLVEDARLTYGLRDENGPLTFEWPGGILRRALLDVAARLVASGRIRQPDHVFDASVPELAAILRGADRPSADELADRFAERMANLDLEAPLTLGPPAPDPPLDALPSSMATMMRISLAVMELLEAEASHHGLQGTGIGEAPYIGTARVVADAEEALDRVEPGDVIVARFTVPTFNSVLAMAGAVVTEQGGLLCHTAVIARELGIPAVIGVRDALVSIPDGAQVEVDPVAGRVATLAPTGG